MAQVSGAPKGKAEKRTVRERTPHNLLLEYPDLELISETRSSFQHIALYRHPELGRVLVHDDVVMLAELYEAAYHEMIAHVPLLYHPDPQRVLVIGGGDGGTSRQVLRHINVEQLVQVEIDAEVVRFCRQHLAELASCYDDARMELRLEDGLHYMADCAAGRHPAFDVILVDSPDPSPNPQLKGPANALFTEAFYQHCRASLKPEGILVVQGETFYGMAKIQRQILETLRRHFGGSAANWGNCGMYTSAIPFYPLGTWSLIYASPKARRQWCLRDEALEELARSEEGLHYLNREMIQACFALPNYALRMIGDLA
ncbi:MAG: spermidine synthase [Spirochaetota bacterium]